MTYRLLLSAALFFAFIQTPCVLAASQEVARPLTFSAPKFQIEDLTADIHSDGRILVVSGKIKNLGFSDIRGYVTVFFKNANHDVLKAVDVEVNENKLIANGQYGKFETSTNIERIQGLANVSVEFTETGRTIY